jgi:hypothetical protein
MSNIKEVDCPFWRECLQVLKQHMDCRHIIKDNHICFCLQCQEKRGDLAMYRRGNPSKEYELPIGFAGFAI